MGIPSAEPARATPVVAAAGVRIGARGAFPALTLDLVLHPGELELIRARHKAGSRDITDALLGLSELEAGRVSFRGRAWHELARHEAFELRRGIGRVQESGNWMETRSVLDNLLLPARHHTVLPEEELRERAGLLARAFGLPGLPLLQPGECTPADLERAACVRAFLGRPALVVLEHPMAFADSELLVPLLNAVQQVRRRGGAVLWFTEHAAHAAEVALSADRRRELVDAHLIDLEPSGR